MPDKNGILTADDKDRAIAWLNDKSFRHECPVCNQNHWSIGEHLINAMPFTGTNLIIGGPSYPMMFVVCNNCAHVRHFMAIPVGLMSEESGGENK